MRCRRPTIKKWRLEHAKPYRYGGPGKGAQRAAWLNAARAELAKGGGKCYATVLLDLVKAYETIPHQRILEAAKKHSYNLWVLRLSLKAYRAPRTIVVDGVCSSPVVAAQVITAGSGSATEELACLLIDVCEELLENYPTLDLTEYVDDLTLGQAGPEWFVSDILASATEFVIDILQNRLELTVSATKSAVLASSHKLSKSISAKVTSVKVVATKPAKMLGAATTAGRTRSTKVLKSRLKQTKTRAKKSGVPKKMQLQRPVVGQNSWHPWHDVQRGHLWDLRLDAKATALGHQLCSHCPCSRKEPTHGSVAFGLLTRQNGPSLRRA